jgi:hypothetical protein
MHAYNRVARGRIVPTYSPEPLEIARWGPQSPKLKPHQIAGARRVLAQRGGLLAFDVGVGKTYTALAVIARARQEGWVRRPVILVPGSLVWKWHDDILCTLPDYRVAVIGSKRKRISRGPAGTSSPRRRTRRRSGRRSGPCSRPARSTSCPQLRRARADTDERGRSSSPTSRASRPSRGRSRCASGRSRRRTPASADPLRARPGPARARRARVGRGDPRAAERLGVRPRRRVGRHRHRHARRRRGRRVQEPLQAAAPRGRRAEVHGRRRRGQRPRVANGLPRRRGPPQDRRRRRRAPDRDAREELAARALQPDPVHRPDGVHEGRHPRPRAVHRPLPQDRVPRGHGLLVRHLDEERGHRVQVAGRPADDHPHLRRVPDRRRESASSCRARWSRRSWSRWTTSRRRSTPTTSPRSRTS